MANNRDNEWERPPNPPGPLFFNKKERDFVKQINDEVIERIIAQTILYYPISLEHTNFHPLYGEAIEKSFLNPIRVHALVEWLGSETETNNYGIDRGTNIIVHFHSRRLQEDQNAFVREGDFILYGNQYYSIVELKSPRELFGQTNYKVEISAICIDSRDGVFNGS